MAKTKEPIEYSCEEVRNVFRAVFSQLAKELGLTPIDVSKPEEPFFLLKNSKGFTVATASYGWSMRYMEWAKNIMYTVYTGYTNYTSVLDSLAEFPPKFAQDLRRYTHFQRTGSWFGPSNVNHVLLLARDITFNDVSDRPIESVDVEVATSPAPLVTVANKVIPTVGDPEDDDYAVTD